MSGGSMDYLYSKVLDAQFEDTNPYEDTTELRKQFRQHLKLVAAALRAIEWNDSGDGANEGKAIRDVLGITRVDFRLLEGEVIAFFVDEHERDGLVMSYMHVGQHSSASYPNADTTPATEAQYAYLKRELESEPFRYKLEVI